MKRFRILLPVVALLLMAQQYYPQMPIVTQPAIGGGGATATAVPTPAAVATIAFANAGVGTTTATITIPATTQANDLCVCAESNGGNTNVVFPANWNPLFIPENNGFATGNRYNAYNHCVLPGEPGTTFILTSTDATLVMCCECYRHTSCNADQGGSSALTSQSLNNHPIAASVTTTEANDFVTHLYGYTNNNTGTLALPAPAGDTLRVNEPSVHSVSNGCMISDVFVASPTAVPSAEPSATATFDVSIGHSYPVTPVTP